MNKQPSTVLVVAVTTVAALPIASLTLIILTIDKSEVPEGWLGLFIGCFSSLVVAVAALAKMERIGRQVDDLSNGKMDAKIRAAVAEVLADHLIDPAIAPQLVKDKVRRSEH